MTGVSGPESTARSRAAMGTVALLALVLIVFGRVVGHDWVNLDDDKLIFANPNLVPPTARGLAEQWRRPHAHLYIPAVYTVWWLIARLALIRDSAASSGFALNPFVFHGANVLVHAVNVLLVRRIVRATVNSDLAATLAAAVFAVHPLQAEAVAWATGMKDLLCGLFSLLAISAAVEATRARETRGRPCWTATIVLYAAALLSKPSAVTTPLVAAAVLWLTGSRPRDRWMVAIVGMALAMPVLWLTQRVQPALDVAPPPVLARPLVAMDAIAFYLMKVVWPFGLTVDYGRTPGAVLASGTAYWTWIAPAALALLLLWRRNRVLVAAAAIFVAALAPNLGLLSFQFQVFSTVADRYAYLSLLALAILVGWAMTAAPRIHPKRVYVTTMLVALLAAITFVQLSHWRDSAALWRHTMEINPRSGLANENLGAAMLEAGDVRGALPLLRAAAEIDPNDPFAHLNLTRAHLAAGDTSAAAQSALALAAAYRRRADFNPDLAAAVLDRFASEIARRGDETSADLLRSEVARLRTPAVEGRRTR